MVNKSCVAMMVALVLGGGTPAFAEWSSDPAISPIVVDERSNSPIVAADNEGGVYVSFRGPRYNRYADTGGFDVFIQHFDAVGNQSWPEPIMLYDTSKGYTSYYGLSTDAEGNAYVANDIYESDKIDESAVHLKKITKSGEQPWGELNLTPEVALTTNGLGITLDSHGDHVVTTWAKSSSTKTLDGYSGLACTNSDGKILWTKDIKIGGKYTFAVQPVVFEDSVIVLIETAAGPDTYQSHFVMQKYALADGSPMWQEPISLTSGDNFLHPLDSGRSVKLISDGKGGVVLSFYHITGPNEGVVYLQHVLESGDKNFAGQGLRISGDELGNGATSLVYDGENYYIAWEANKLALNADGAITNYSAIKGVAIDSQGQFFWNNGVTSPTFIKEWKPIFRVGDLADWFSGYQNPNLVLNEDGNINLTYGTETTYSYYLYAEVLDKDSGTSLSEPKSFSNGPIKVQGQMSFDRTIFGQPLLAYVTGSSSSGEIRLVNFDGKADSGVNEGVLVEKIMPVEVMPGESKQVQLKVLDNHGSSHEGSVTSESGMVSTELSMGVTDLNVVISADDWLDSSDAVTVKVQDLDNIDRVGISSFKVQAPATRLTQIQPFETKQVEENTTVQISATITSSDAAQLTIDWQQIAGPAVEYSSDKQDLAVVTGFVAEDTTLTFSASVNDGHQVVEQEVDLFVENTLSPLISGTDSTAVPGDLFNFTPIFENAKAPVSVNWSQLEGVRTVYIISPNGDLQGTAPLAEGLVTFSLEAVDANGEEFEKSFSLKVANEIKEDKDSGGSLAGFSLLFLTMLASWKRTFANKKNKFRGNHV